MVVLFTTSYRSLAKCHEKGHKMPHPMLEPTVTQHLLVGANLLHRKFFSSYQFKTFKFILTR